MGSNTSIPAKYDVQANGCLSAFIVLTTVAIVARGVSRRILKAPFGADDALAYLAYVTNLASLINELIEVDKGIFDLQRLATMTPSVVSSIQKHNFASAFMYIVTITSAKLSILSLFRRIFYVHTGWFMGFWWFNFLIILPCWAVATLCILIYVQIDEFAYTKPINAYGTFACALVNAISDVMVLVLPIREVLRLQLPRARRFGIAGLFSIGFLTTMVSFSRAILVYHQTNISDTKWNPAYTSYNFIMFGAAESSAACLCACIPVTRPFFLKAGQFATRSLTGASLRALMSRTNVSSQSTQGYSEHSIPGENSRKDKISRTVEIDLDSMPLTKTSSAKGSLDRTMMLGYTENHESPATGRAWA